MTRDEAYTILTKYLTNKNLLKHSLATEVTMRALAPRFKEDVEVWGITGLLHDADYELAKNNPEKHGLLLFEKEIGTIPPPIEHAIKAHNYELTNILPENAMDWAITCCDELTGIIVASALIHPEKKLHALTPEFVLNRMKQKDFAKGARRERIAFCEAKLGIPLEEFVTITLHAMQGIAEELGL